MLTCKMLFNLSRGIFLKYQIFIIFYHINKDINSRNCILIYVQWLTTTCIILKQRRGSIQERWHINHNILYKDEDDISLLFRPLSNTHPRTPNMSQAPLLFYDQSPNIKPNNKVKNLKETESQSYLLIT